MCSNSKGRPLPQPNYSLTPAPSPNGITPPNLPQGEEHLTGTGEKKSLPSPNYSLTPNPSPNREGSENYCLQIKEASCQIEERLSSIRRNALLDCRRASL